MAALIIREVHAISQSQAPSEDRGRVTFTVSVALAVLSAFTVALRFLSRLKIQAPIQWDDWLCIPSLALVICISIELGISIQYGLGKHIQDADSTVAWKLLQVGFFLSLTWTLVHWFIKMSILLFYIRIFTLYVKWFKVAVYVAMAYHTGLTLSMLFFIPLQCRPLQYFWTRYKIQNPPAQGVCNYDAFWPPVATSGLNTLGDIVILILPILVLNNLQLKKSKKLALLSVFLVGAFACAASIVRLVSIVKINNLNADVTWITGEVYLWTMIEASVGLMCACFPAWWPLVRGVIDKVTTKKYSYPSGKGFSQLSRKKGSWPQKDNSEFTPTDNYSLTTLPVLVKQHSETGSEIPLDKV